MAVLKRFRDLSKMEFYKQGLKLRQSLEFWLVHDLKLRVPGGYTDPTPPKLEDLPDYVPDMENSPQYKEFIRKQNATREVKYYNVETFSEDKKLFIISQVRDMMSYIVKANSIYIGYNCKRCDVELRTQYQSKAIACLHSVVEELFETRTLFPYDLNKIDCILEYADSEDILLSKWKSSDYKKARKYLGES